MRREERTTTKSNPIAGRLSRCSSPRTVATTTRADSLVKNGSEQGYGMVEKNVYQVADWNGRSGERWVAYQARLDAMMAVFGRPAIYAPAPATGERGLDIGCGAGASSLDLAARVGAGGHVLGVDISEPLIGKARALAAQDTAALVHAGDVRK